LRVGKADALTFWRMTLPEEDCRLYACHDVCNDVSQAV